MEEKMYSYLLAGSYLFMAYSSIRLVSSVMRFNRVLKDIDYSGIRKDVNHVKDSLSMRNV